MLSELYAHLAQAQDAEQAAPIAKTIEGLWACNDSPTIIAADGARGRRRSPIRTRRWR